MKIQCDVCEKAPATVICCADEAALCAKCNIEVHAASIRGCSFNPSPINSLHVTYVKALFCRDCDEPIHSASSLSANHQRFLATGIRVALTSSCTKDSEKSNQGPEPEPPNHNAQSVSIKMPTQQSSSFTSPSWAVDDLLHLSDIESSDKAREL